MAKTTLDISDGLLLRAKRRALELRTPLRKIMETALRNYLSQRPLRVETVRNRPKHIKWVTVDGRLPNDLDVSSRVAMHEWLRKGK